MKQRKKKINSSKSTPPVEKPSVGSVTTNESVALPATLVDDSNKKPSSADTPPPPALKTKEVHHTPAGVISNNSSSASNPSRLDPPGLKKKASKLLQDLHQTNAHSNLEQKIIPITETLVMELMEDYKKELMKVPEKQPFVTQLEMMKINFIDSAHIQFECYSAMAQSYADKAAEEFREFIREKTLDKVVRVTTHLDISQRKEIIIEQPKTKLEIFHEMIQNFPFIEVLKSKYRFDVE